MIIISYRPNYSVYEGCGHYRHGGDSALAFGVAETPEEAADFIARQIHQDPKAECGNYVYDRWEDIHGHFDRCYNETGLQENSVYVPGAYAETEEEEQHEVERAQLCHAISLLVKERLGALSAEAQKKAEEERRREAIRAQEYRLAEQQRKEREDYDRLRKKFETETK